MAVATIITVIIVFINDELPMCNRPVIEVKKSENVIEIPAPIAPYIVPFPGLPSDLLIELKHLYQSYNQDYETSKKRMGLLLSTGRTTCL
jgi:hypothetical protein